MICIVLYIANKMQDLLYNPSTPHILVVDNFYKNVDALREHALSQSFVEDNRYYKGKRTKEKFLFPYVKEEFERLLQARIIDWVDQPMNGVFQITSPNDMLVYHSDSQDYAAAVYLTPDADSNGTSFWRDKKYGCRRPPNHILENKNSSLTDEVYSHYNITHEDNWSLVDKVGAVYNRLVIWDAKLIHSASEYSAKERLVQLFFFSIQK